MKKLNLTVYTLMLAFSMQAQWSQVGGDINGESKDDWSGQSITLNASGDVIAVGAHRNDDTDISAGHVRVLKLIDSEWTQVGPDIDGEAENDLSGYSISISDDGNTIAIGAPFNSDNGERAGHVRVYTWDGRDWDQVGDDIDGLTNDESGHSVSLSALGDMVVVGSPKSSKGTVRTYTLVSDTWEKSIADLNGESSDDNFGSSVSLSANGQFLAVGAPLNNGEGSDAGHVRVYELEGGSWSKIDSDIDGQVSGDEFGSSVAINNDGTVLVSGAPKNDENGANSGSVSIYNLEDGKWELKGESLHGDNTGDLAGQSVAINAEGNIISYGANNSGGSGVTFVYRWDGTSWIKIKEEVTGENTGDASGKSIALNSLGTKLAIGATLNRGEGEINDEFGHARVFELSCEETYGTDVKVSCEPIEWIDGIIYSASTNTPTFTLVNSEGCDSIVTLDLTIDPINLELESITSSLTALESDGTFQWLDCDNDYAVIDGEKTRGISSNCAGNFALEITKHGCVDTTECATIEGAASEANWAIQDLIYGDASGDESGTSVSLSGNGNFVAIGSPKNTGAGSEAGHVRVFGKVGEGWEQMGADIDAEAPGDLFGASLALSDDGLTLVVGAPNNDENGDDAGQVKVFEFDGSRWNIKGEAITGLESEDFAGSSVAINNIGSIIAFGSPGYDKKASGFFGSDKNEIGQVSVYQWDEGSWTALGSAIVGADEGDESGNSISLSEDGSLIAIGAPKNDGEGSNSGHVRVYQLDGTSWDKIGGDINGNNNDDNFGTSVQLNNDGTSLVVGSPMDDESGENAGRTTVFKFDGSNWNKKGNTILGENGGDQSGSSVAISGDGNTVVIGSPTNGEMGTNSGQVEVWEWCGTEWLPKGSDIQAEATGDENGYAVSISDDASLLAIGARFNDDFEPNAGQVRIFENACDGIDFTVVKDGVELTSNQDEASYQWLDCEDDYAFIEGATSQTFIAEENGTYAVEITMGSCVDTSICTPVTSVGFEDALELENVSVYPNPSHGQINVDFGRLVETGEIQVLDAYGKMVFQQTISNENNISINLEEQSRGVYLVLINSEGQQSTNRVVKN